jgi:PTH1 family peptidyl-tRNA hydrolase
MYLFVGLGNVGKEYENTRHNAGFLCVDEIVNRYNFNNHITKFNADIYSGNVDNKKIIIAKPRTYMNRSGVAVSQIKAFYKIFLENIYVFHDDLDLDFCRVKYKIGGGSAGHNGISNIQEMIGKNFHRIRIGIGRPEFKSDTSDFVLKKFNSEELKEILNLNARIVDSIEELFKENKSEFVRGLNSLFLKKTSQAPNKKQ